MGPATLLKNAVIVKAAMWELVPLDTECVAHVKLHSWKIRIILYRVRGLFSLIFFSVSLGCGEKSVENNTYFQVLPNWPFIITLKFPTLSHSLSHAFVHF